MNTSNSYRLSVKNSMGTQFGSLPKPNLNMIIREPHLIRITAYLKINKHNEEILEKPQKYIRKIIKTYVIVPEQYKEHPIGKIENTNENNWAYHHKWAKYLPIPKINEENTDHYKYIYTIKKVEIIENQKYKNKNGYLIMASDGSYSDYENEPYCITKTLAEAKTMAKEAVTVGSKRDSKWRTKMDWIGQNPTCIKKFDRASIINLDNMKGCLFCEDCYPDYVYHEIDKTEYRF